MPTFDEVLADFLPDSFVDALDPYQRRLVGLLVEAGNDDWDIIGIWLRLSGPPSTFPMGSDTSRDFSSSFRSELRALLCNDEKYTPERTKLLSQGEITQAALIASIAAILAPALGTAAVFIATPVAVALKVVGHLGIAAWCAEEQPAD